MEERWLPVRGYDGLYEVSSLGLVRSVDRWVRGRWGTGYFQRGRTMRQNVAPNGYHSVELFRSGESKRVSIHRLVAFAFLPERAGATYVNHINGVKSNNAASNLEWATASENERHSYRTLGKQVRGKKPLIAYNDRGDVLRFASANEAGRLGFHQSAIVGVLKGRTQTHAGYRWRYA